MKKIFIGILFLVMYFVGCASTTSTPSMANIDLMTLDQVIAEAAVRIDERITAGVKIAPLNFNSPSERFSSYVLDELTVNLVESGKLIVVDRSEINLIRSEFDFQYSGDVGDDSMQALGRMLGAQSIISGSLTDMGGFYRLMIRVLNVQNASVEVQYRANIINDSIVVSLLSGGRANIGQTTQNQTQQTVQVPTQQTNQTSSQMSAVIVEGATLTEKLQWLEENAANNTEYLVVVTGNESLSAPVLSYPRRRNVTVKLISSGEERILSLTGNGSILTIESDVTLILDNGISLQGRNGNNAALVRVNSRGLLIMNSGAKIFGNITSSWGGGVYVAENGSFTMTGGEITGNNSLYGGGIFMDTNSNFIMSGGEIYNNTATGGGGSDFGGGGIFISGATFTMTGGIISNNTASGIGFGGGGGVHLANNGSLTMRGGEIYSNTARSNGGGVIVRGATFTITGGEIAGNTASSGGGVYVISGTFTKTGGVIYGSTGDRNDNTAGNGHAVGGRFIRNNIAGSGVRLDSSRNGAAGGWEN